MCKLWKVIDRMLEDAHESQEFACKNDSNANNICIGIEGCNDHVTFWNEFGSVTYKFSDGELIRVIQGEFDTERELIGIAIDSASLLAISNYVVNRAKNEYCNNLEKHSYNEVLQVIENHKASK